MILEVLKEVISKRKELNSDDTQIQLSSVFMKQAIKEINEYAMCFSSDNNNNPVVSKPHLSRIWFEDYIIHNRAYRDDTNDPDVEETIIEFLNQKK